jgi:deoxyhypusine synthase
MADQVPTSSLPANAAPAAPSGATAAVLKPSDPVPQDSQQVQGLEFDDFFSKGRNVSAAEMVEHFAHMGFQASSLGKAKDIIDGMVSLHVHENSPKFQCPSELFS